MENFQTTASRTMTDFKAQRSKHRYRGKARGGNGRTVHSKVTKWEKKTQRVYTSTEEKYEELLVEMIMAIKMELPIEKEQLGTKNKVNYTAATY